MGIRVTRDNLVPLHSLTPLFMAGLASLLALAWHIPRAAGLLQAGVYRHQAILALVHVTFLGWGTSIALAALQQLTPVVFGTELHRPALVRYVAVLHVAGVISLVYGLFTLRSPFLHVGAMLIPVGVLLATVNVWRSQRPEAGPGPGQAARLIQPFVKSALMYLLSTVVLGAVLAVNLTSGVLGPGWLAAFSAHMTLGMIGWFGMLVFGVSYHLMPFFGITAKKRVPRWAGVVRCVLHAGIVALWLGTWPVGWGWLQAAGIVCLAAATGLFVSDGLSLYAPREKNRMHPMVTYIRIGHLYLAALALGGVVVLFAPPAPRTWVALGVAYAGGWLTNTILGYLHRILPFFVWHNKYWGRTSEPGVPAFRHMVAEGPAWLGLALYNAGVLGMVLALTTPLPLAPYAWLTALGLVVSGGNLVRTLWR